MDPVLAVVLGSMQADMARMDRVAMNIANAQTAGYKREVVTAAPFGTRIDAAGEPRLTIRTDARPGTLKPTGQALDFALAGPGWFEVLTPQGPAYTRQGQFRLDAASRLVTQQGHPVMGMGGEIVLPSGAPVVDAAGRVFASSTAVGEALAQLKVVQFPSAAPVERRGDGLVLLHGEAMAAPEGAVRIHQGFLENSNVSHLQEMVRLIETVRHLETLQKVALGYDEMLGASIRKLGEAG